ncbi:MAG: LacI family transcriptional regulator [Oscillospiraceae bacterium]|nr:LacI family transcriptional regulator [Oscillospiraceae bacterium]
MATIYDVAAASGFSPATVSKAFNSYPGINQKTFDKIMQTAKEIGYIPNSTARALTTKKSWLVGMLFSEELFTGIKHPHFGEIFSSAQIHLGKAGYDVVFINNALGGENISYLEHCRYRGVDGVFMAASASFGKAVQCIVDSDVKMVSVEFPYPQKYSVLSENYNGAMLAMEHLRSLGHRKIACISGPLFSPAAAERYQGYRDFLSAHAMHFNPGLVVEATEFTAADGYDAVAKLVSVAKDKFTAIFATYDDWACAAINYLRENGYKVPEDISVVGFDDLVHAEFAGLTTIRQDREKIGCIAADVLIAQMQDMALDFPHDVRVPTSLVVRSSCSGIA